MTGLSGLGLVAPTYYYLTAARLRPQKHPRYVHEKIPSAGIHVGEIIGWRVWELPGDFITSVFHHDVWLPGVPMHGKGLHLSGGIHAWKSRLDAAMYAGFMGSAGVVGRVALWGEVVEHERGYRAEFAKPVSFDSLHHSGVVLRERRLRKLRELYGLEARP